MVLRRFVVVLAALALALGLVPPGLTASPAAAQVQALATATAKPILVITSPADPFTQYYSEILNAEGLSEYNRADLSAITSVSALSPYDVVLLAPQTLTSAQVTVFTSWVGNGGNLIAMRPDKKLAGLLGLTAEAGTLSDGYIKIDTSRAPGKGIVAETIQFHDTADMYALSGAREVAKLYRSAGTATANPAVTLRNVGTREGQAAAFTFDVARSVIWTRQGNPDWAGQDRDGLSPIRPNDLFHGGADTDWVNLDKVQIPQADELQRLLANLVLDMNADRMPLPRLWYLPKQHKAAIIMTGDDHAMNGTAARFDEFLADSPAGCSVADWECIRGTSYLFATTAGLADARAADFVSQGFEVGLHPNTDCANSTPSALATTFTSQLAAFGRQFPSVPRPVTSRNHCIVWSDWASVPKVEQAQGIRLDTNYYYWPEAWVGNRPGFFTGSGIPMRFADSDGKSIDVFQAATQMTDESGQTYPFTADALLDRALGSQGYYGAFTINAHTDSADSQAATATVAAAKKRGVPVVSAKQMLDWVDGRSASSFRNFTWSGGQLSFDLAANAKARNLTVMVPVQSGAGRLTSIRRGSTAVSYQTKVIKGVEYALLTAPSGRYTAAYGTPSKPAPPVVKAPGAPSGVRVSSVRSLTPKSAQATVVWTAPAGNGGSSVSGYRVRVNQTGAVQQVSRTAAVISGLRPGTRYTFSVSAGNRVGWSPFSAASPVLVPPAPKAGVGVKAVSRGGKLRVDVNPNKGRGYWKFTVQKRTTSGTWRNLRTYRTKGKSETRTVNLARGTYRVRVKAKYGYAANTSTTIPLSR